MSIYLTVQQAVIDMHEREFTNDFKLYGNDLLWVQNKSFIHMGEFLIVEYHRLYFHSLKQDDLEIFGIVVLQPNVRGILLNTCCRYSAQIPTVITKNLKEFEDRIICTIPFSDS